LATGFLAGAFFASGFFVLQQGIQKFFRK